MPYHFSGSWIRFGKCSSFFRLPDLNPFLRRNVHSIPFLNSIGIIKFLEITYHTVDPQNAGAMFVRFRHSLRIFAGCGSQPGFCIGPEKFIIIRGSLLFQHLQGTGILFRRTRRLYRFLVLPARLRHLCSTSKQYHGRHCHRQQTNQYSFFHLRSPFIFCYLPSALIFGKCTVKGMVFAYL